MPKRLSPQEVFELAGLLSQMTQDQVDEMIIELRRGETLDRDALLRRLVDIQYTRNDIDFHRGTFRVRGDVVEIKPAYEEEIVRVEFFGDEIERIAVVDPISGEVIASFALTEPGAGSDAGAMSASGVVFKGEDGKLYLFQIRPFVENKRASRSTYLQTLDAGLAESAARLVDMAARREMAMA